VGNMRQTSIQRRLIAAVVISQLLLAIGIVSVAVFFTRRQLRNAFDAGLHGRAMSIAALVRYSEDEHPTLIFEDDLVPPPVEKQHPDLYQVTTGDGRVLARSPNWPLDLQAIPKKDRQHANFAVDGIRYRAVRLENVPVLDREGDAPSTDVLTVTYAAPTDQMTRAIAHAAIYIAAGSGLLLLVTVALAVLGLRRGLRPLAELATSAASVNTSNWKLNPSEAAVSTTELAPLTQAMTAMLDGLHRAFTQQREFLANAAHELKTPVAILKSTLQSLLQRPRAAEEYRAGLEQALDDMARLEQLMHSMLRLARAEQWAAGSTRRDLEAVEVAATCESALERLASVARERGVTIHFVSNGPMPMRADADDLELVWSNLLQNAIRFSPAGGNVQLRVRANGQRGYIEVEDEGPGIPQSELAHLFERFHRSDSSRARNTGGYGLGLAISKALIEAYGGTITPASRPGQGMRMVVEVPLENPAFSS
jgi:two-component system OmpR family sensor kinase